MICVVEFKGGHNIQFEFVNEDLETHFFLYYSHRVCDTSILLIDKLKVINQSSIYVFVISRHFYTRKFKSSKNKVTLKRQQK
jgi:hypothetical protein